MEKDERSWRKGEEIFKPMRNYETVKIMRKIRGEVKKIKVIRKVEKNF